jgi:hypothetical protein
VMSTTTVVSSAAMVPTAAVMSATAVSATMPAPTVSTAACKRRLRYDQHGKKGPAKSQSV